MENSRLSFMFAFFSLTLLAFAGCGKEGNNFSLAPSVERFAGRDIIPDIDVLWVVDSSGSMFPKQENLASNFDSFIGAFTSKEFDFRISIITADLSSDGEDGNFQGTPTVITSSVDDYMDVFKNNIMVGDLGNSQQKALDAIEKALSTEKLSNENEGFWRKAAHLAVVVVSDADDNDSVATADDVFSFLGKKKPDVLDPSTGVFYDGFSVHAIVGQRDQDCDLVTEKGTRFIELAELSGGFVGDICDSNFSDGLSNISDRILQFITYVALAREPNPDTIKVTVNGVFIPNDSANGWVYDGNKNRILFNGSSIPEASSSIEVTYVPKAFGSNGINNKWE